jgi:hypothetical protein
MSTEPKNKWRLLHELCLKVKEAKDFETLGAVVEELSELKTAERNAAKFGNGQYFEAVSNAYIAAWKKLGQWQENPPPIAPQETQIGPGNPFPIPPPPPPPTLTAEQPSTPVPGEWTGALVFERIAPKGLTNPVGYRAATPEEQAELDRIARAINRNTPLFEPVPQVPGSLDELRKTIICAITNEKEAVNGQYGGADVGRLLNALVRMVDKAFADHAAQNSKAIERAAEPVKTPEPWTGDELYEAFRQAVWGAGKKEDWQRFSDSVRDDFLILAMLVNQRMGSAPSPLKPWTAEGFYHQFGQPLGRLGTVTSVRLSSAQREACEKAAAVINKWAGLVS